MKELFNKKKEVFKFDKYFAAARIPVITLYQNGKEFNFIVDTGSDNCILDKETLNRINYENVNMTMSLSGLGTEQQATVCKTVFSGYGVEFLVVDLSTAFEGYRKNGFIVAGMIGVSFLHTFGFIIDFTKMEMYREV